MVCLDNLCAAEHSLGEVSGLLMFADVASNVSELHTADRYRV